MPERPDDIIPNVALFIHGPPDVFIKDGLGHVVDISGERRLERVMSIHTLLVYARRMERFLVEWQVENGPIETDEQ